MHVHIRVGSVLQEITLFCTSQDFSIENLKLSKYSSSKIGAFISKYNKCALQSNLSFRTTNLSVSSFLEVFKDLLMNLVAQKINSCLGTRLTCDKVVYLVWCQFHNCYFTIIQETNLRNFFAWAFWRLTSVNAMSLKSAYTQFMCQNRQT